MIIARTLKQTVHGNPGERRVLPAGLLIEVEPASNLPADSGIRWWAKPLPLWPADTYEWAQETGVGLEAGDVEVIENGHS